MKTVIVFLAFAGCAVAQYFPPSGGSLGVPIGAASGGTGVTNDATNTVTFSGHYSLGITLSANTSLTFPTSGTLATTAGNVATATNLATYPTPCSGGQFSTGYTTGTPPTNNCGTPAGGGNVSNSGTPVLHQGMIWASATTAKGISTFTVDDSGNLVATSVGASTLKDANGNPFLISTATSSAVDSVTITNAATANPATVTIGATGSDTNINLSLAGKGTGVVQAPGGIATGSSPPTNTAGTGGMWAANEGTAASAASGTDVCYGDSTSHDFTCSLNNGSFLLLPLLNGTQTAKGLLYNDATTTNYADSSADFTVTSHTLASGASGILDLSAATGTAALKVPANSSNTATAASVIDYDSTNSNYHANNGADSIFGVFATASLPATGHMVSATVASNKVTLSDGGVIGTAAAANTATACSAGNVSLGWTTGSNNCATANASLVGLGSVTNDAQTKAAIVPNTAPAAGQLLVGNAGGTAYAPVTASGSCTLASTGAFTCSGGGGGYATVQSPPGTNLTQETTLVAGDNLSAATSGSTTVMQFNPFDGTSSIQWDEFLTTGASTLGSLAWHEVTNATSCSYGIVEPPAGGPPGIVSAVTSTTTGSCLILLGNTGAGIDSYPRLDTTTNWEFWFTVQPQSIASPAAVKVGLFSANYATTVTQNTIHVFMDTADSSNWTVTTCNNSSSCQTGGSLGVAATTTDWWTIRIRSTTAGVARASVAKNNGAFSAEVTVGTGQTVNQALPTVGMSPVFYSGNTSATVETLYIDYWAGKMNNMTVRPRAY